MYKHTYMKQDKQKIQGIKADFVKKRSPPQ
ncbi:hypothetical protein UNH65_21190 [Chitinophaga sp. 180180018-2]|nr:hypothetical protein [Chitinophaga sp. 212800010-3]